MNSEDTYDNSDRFSFFFLYFCFQGILQLAYK